MRIAILLFLIFTSAFAFEFEETEKSLFFQGKLANVNSSSLFNQNNILSLNKRYADFRGYYGFKVTSDNEKAMLYLRNKAEVLRGDAEKNQEITIDEGYLTLTPLEELYIDVGKKNFKYGAFHGFTTFNLFEKGNPLINEDNYFKESATITKFFGENASTALSVIKRDKNYKADAIWKGSFSISKTDTNLYAFMKNEDRAIGFDVSQIKGESIKLKLGSVYYVRKGSFKLENYTLTPQQEKALKVLSSIEYSSVSGLNFIVEYLHNTAGLSKNQINQYYNYAQVNPFFGMQSNGFYDFLNLNKNYLFFMVYKKNIYNKLDLSLSSYLNLEDNGLMIISETKYKITNSMSGKIRLIIPAGKQETEFRRFYKQSILLSLEYVF